MHKSEKSKKAQRNVNSTPRAGSKPANQNVWFLKEGGEKQGGHQLLWVMGPKLDLQCMDTHHHQKRSQIQLIDALNLPKSFNINKLFLNTCLRQQPRGNWF